MRITTLSLTHFRNFLEVEEILFPEEPLLIALAPNATGKTNFLESIHFLLRGKSFRASVAECVQWGQDFFSVQASIKRAHGESTLLARYQVSMKTLRLEEDGVPASLATFYSQYPFVLFLPEDTFMFERGPAQRRNFLNTTLVASPTYFSSLVQYHRVLRQRNAALKQAKGPDEIQAWSSLLVEHGREVWRERQSFIRFLQEQLTPLYESLGTRPLPLEVRFAPGVADIDSYSDLLAQAWAQESRYQYTLYGPHRDDFDVLVDGRPANAVLSRGQMRLLVVTLKVAAYYFMKQTSGEEPILLLDEILSELDPEAQRALLAHLPSAQTLLTCSQLPGELRNRQDVHMLDLRHILGAPIEEQPPLASLEKLPALVA